MEMPSSPAVRRAPRTARSIASGDGSSANGPLSTRPRRCGQSRWRLPMPRSPARRTMLSRSSRLCFRIVAVSVGRRPAASAARRPATVAAKLPWPRTGSLTSAVEPSRLTWTRRLSGGGCPSGAGSSTAASSTSASSRLPLSSVPLVRITSSRECVAITCRHRSRMSGRANGSPPVKKTRAAPSAAAWSTASRMRLVSSPWSRVGPEETRQCAHARLQKSFTCTHSSWSSAVARYAARPR